MSDIPRPGPLHRWAYIALPALLVGGAATLGALLHPAVAGLLAAGVALVARSRALAFTGDLADALQHVPEAALWVVDEGHTVAWSVGGLLARLGVPGRQMGPHPLHLWGEDADRDLHLSAAQEGPSMWASEDEDRGLIYATFAAPLDAGRVVCLTVDGSAVADLTLLRVRDRARQGRGVSDG